MGKIRDFVFGTIEKKLDILFGKVDFEATARLDDLKVELGPCCFCGRDIAVSEIDSCAVTVETAKAKWQTWFCHAECYKDRIVKHADTDLTPAHF